MGAPSLDPVLVVLCGIWAGGDALGMCRLCGAARGVGCAGCPPVGGGSRGLWGVAARAAAGIRIGDFGKCLLGTCLTGGWVVA